MEKKSQKKAPTDMITGIISKRRKPWRRKKKKLKIQPKKLQKKIGLQKSRKNLHPKQKRALLKNLKKLNKNE